MTKLKYPKNRKIRTDTLKADLLRRHSLEHIRDIWTKHGMYEAGKILRGAPDTIRYVAICNNFKRPLPEHLVIAHQRGNWSNFTTNYMPETNKSKPN